MLRILKLAQIILLLFIINGVKNNIIGCKLYSQCEARARYEEQLCVGHEWRKPNFLSPSFPMTITNKSRCYTTLKPEFNMIEKLETEMFDEYYRCLINGDEDIPNEECDRENFIDIKFDGAVDSPISCFNGKLRIERECGFLKVCCPRIQKCSEERRKSSVIFKILELHKQLKSQLLICKNGSKNKRRHPNNDKINEGRLNIRIGNFLDNFDRIEMLSNLKEAPKEGIIHSSNLKDKKKNFFVDNRKVEETLSSVISENNHKSSGGSKDNNKESSSSEIGMINTSRNNNGDEENNGIKNKVKKVLCQKEKNNRNSDRDVKDVNSIILNEWFNNKINTGNNKKTIEESSNNIEKSSRIKFLNGSEKSKEKNTLNRNNKELKVTSNTISQNGKKNLLKENEKLTIEKSKQKNITNEESTLYKESSKKNKSTAKNEKGEVSDPFILSPDKFQKIYFPKVNSSTQYPPYLEIATKDTYLTFENVTSTKMPTKDDNGKDNYYKKEKESTMNKETNEGNNNSESINHKIVNHQLSNNYYSSQNLSKEEKYEDKHEKSEFSNFITIDNHKEKNNNKNFVNRNSRINDVVNGIDIMKKEYQDHLQKILELKKKEEEEMRKKEKVSFFKLNSARKSSYEERNEELIEMTGISSEENIMKKNNSISIREDNEAELNQIFNIVKNCKLRYAGAVKLLDDNTKPISLKNSFINWKKSLDEKLIKVKDDKTISIETFNELYDAIQRDTSEIAKIISNNGNKVEHDDKIFGDIICQPIENKEEEDIIHTINDNNNKKSIDMFKKTHSMAHNLRIPNETQFLTSCDYYVKCRSHINLLLDKCASLITERPAIPSTESILLSGLNMCGEINVPFLSELYSLYTKRNMNLRTCLKKHDNIGGSTEVCTNKINNLILTTKEIIKYQEEQFELGKCFSDVNNLQNKCYQMSKCCPEYEECKKSINDIRVERKMIYLTSKITENNQNCLEKFERKFFSYNK